MSFFPVAFHELAPLFHVIDEASRPSPRQCAPCAPAALRQRSLQRTFQPRFDVKELKSSYELLGEFPGAEQKDINIEWTDGTTLTISGHFESRAERSAPAPGPATTPTPTETVAEEKHAETASYHAPSVEEEDDDDGELISKPGESDTETVASTPEKAAETNTVADPETSTPEESSVDEPKYWVSERQSGSFSRGFTFPVRIEQENVKASLKNGILRVVVPKAVIPARRTIVVE